SAKAPSARCPGSATESVASPAVETTFAVVAAVYVLPTPGVNVPSDAGGPSASESVAGTVPPTSPCLDVDVGTSPTVYVFVVLPSSEVTVTVAVPGSDAGGAIETVPLCTAVAETCGGCVASTGTLT